MRAVGIICEYNPFHQGHARQLAAARRDTSADVVLCVMSEHLTQRGEPALADPYTRAAAAVSCGADLVVGLPFPYSTAPAEFFATAAIRILTAMGAVALHFGSESPLEELMASADILSSPDFTHALADRQRTHPEEGVMQARSAVFSSLTHRSLPGGSNDLLATAYLQVLHNTKSRMVPYGIRREGQEYRDHTAPSTQIPASAAALRHLWEASDLTALQPYLPENSYRYLVDAVSRGIAPLRINESISGALLWYYRTSPPELLSRCACMEGGLANRLIRAANNAGSLEEMISASATKRYTTSRIYRAIWMGACQVTPEDLNTPPAYVRLLSFNDVGRRYLAQLRRTCPLPILTKPSALPDHARGGRQATIDARLESLISLMIPSSQKPFCYKCAHPVYLPSLS